MEPIVSAKDILEQIQSEPLQHLLTSIQYETSPPGNTKIPALDSYIHSVTTHIHPSLDASLNRGDVLEIQGPAASGKTQLLYHLLITCIMPSHHWSSDLGGWDETAILLDTDGVFDIHRFRQLLVSRLTRMLPSQKSTESVDARGGALAEELASQCLVNLHVFRPTSSLQLAATLLHLPTYHSNNSHMQASQIGLLAIDSMSAFYWKDRFTVEQVRDAAHGGNASKLTDASSLNPMRHVLTALNKFRISHGPVIVMTNWGLNPLRKPLPTGEPSSPFYKQHLYPFPSPFEVSHPTAAQSVNINPEKAYPRPSDHSSPPPSHAFKRRKMNLLGRSLWKRAKYRDLSGHQAIRKWENSPFVLATRKLLSMISERNDIKVFGHWIWCCLIIRRFVRTQTDELSQEAQFIHLPRYLTLPGQIGSA